MIVEVTVNSLEGKAASLRKLIDNSLEESLDSLLQKESLNYEPDK